MSTVWFLPSYACRIWALGMMLTVAGMGLLHSGETIDPDAPVDVSKLELRHCKRCLSAGSVQCHDCRGNGISFNAELPCPKCNATGKIPCDECDDEGTIRCSKCRKRTVGEETIRAMKNPEWEEWDGQYGKTARRRGTISTDVPPPEPPEYVLCTYCKGTERRPCPDCEGTKKAKCQRCKGDGIIHGRGACKTCHGSGREPCPECAVMEGIEGIEGMVALEELRKQKLVSEDEYFKKRRLLVAQENYRKEVLAERKAMAEKRARERSAREEAKVAAEKAEREETVDDSPATEPVVDWRAREERLNVLAKGFQSKVLNALAYESKLKEIGLPLERVQAIEDKLSATNPRLQRLVKLKKSFREGHLTADEFQERLADL